MVLWWRFLLVFLFGILSVALLIGGGVSLICFPNSPGKGYRIAAIACALGTISGGIAGALVLQESWVIWFSIGVALFIALPLWIESRLVDLPIQKQVKLTLYLIVGVFLLMAIGALVCRLMP